MTFFECDCCDRPVCYDKKPGIGYLCDPCVKCFMADPPLTGDEPLPDGVTCYFVDDLTWMQAQALHARWAREKAQSERNIARYLRSLPRYDDMDVLDSEEMWSSRPS